MDTNRKWKVKYHLPPQTDVLRIASESEVFSCSSLQERTVTIRRQTIGGFGLSIKVNSRINQNSSRLSSGSEILTANLCAIIFSQGGAEHKIPVVISKISKEQKGEMFVFSFPTLIQKHEAVYWFILCLCLCSQLNSLGSCLLEMGFFRYVFYHCCCNKYTFLDG